MNLIHKMIMIQEGGRNCEQKRNAGKTKEGLLS